MVRELIHDPILLAKRSAPATAEDLPIAQDLLDTLRFHKDTCVGMAANMIGRHVCIIAFWDGKDHIVVFNPEIIQASGEYEAEEGCLSLLGGLKTYTGWTAQIIQHEIDHCNGVLI